MPRILKIEDELQKADAAIDNDPSFRFPAVTRINAATYKKIIQECANSGRTLSHVIEDLLTTHYRLQETGVSVPLDTQTRTVLTSLSMLWGISAGEAAGRVLASAALAVLNDELETRESVQNVQKRVKALTGK